MTTFQVQVLVADRRIIRRDGPDSFTPKGEYGNEDATAGRSAHRFHAILRSLDLDFEHNGMGIKDRLFHFEWRYLMTAQVEDVIFVPIKFLSLHTCHCNNNVDTIRRLDCSP